MYKLWAAIVKDYRILLRDKAGLAVMFAMPILLVVVIASIQDSSFKLINDNSVPLLLCNKDTGQSSRQLVESLQKIGMFDMQHANPKLDQQQLSALMEKQDALVAVVIPSNFSAAISSKSRDVARKALSEMGMAIQNESKDTTVITSGPVTMLYNPVLQESFRYSVQGALRSAQQLVESRQVVQALYTAINNKDLPASLEKQILSNQAQIAEIPIRKDNVKHIPNTTQHNVPAWTIFAMFFIVVSLSTSVVKEKVSGSFIRLKTLPTNYLLVMAAKQISYIGVTLAQVVVIFSLGIWFFPVIGLPKLDLPSDIGSLLLVSLICGWCAVSYGILIGTYARTIEQAIGFGAVSVVILAAIGGIVVPAFAMPDSLQLMMKVSPLHWCLEAYYELFLEGGHLKDIIVTILPLLGITFAIQLAAILGLKRQHLI